jgi:serine/threonine protein kinase
MSNASVRTHESLESLVAQVIDEFRERQKQGERPDVEEYAARYPQAAELLRKVLASWQLIALSEAGIATAAGAASGEHESGILGDFRIVREVSRGGMGVVYEAEQVSLKRRVALKVLPFAATMDPRWLQRFQNEAQAAAGLHHTNIVPVYSVGSERGVHYYAMQYIEGRDLASVLAQLRGQARGPQPDPRLVATVDAADAQPVVPACPAAVDSRPIAGLSTEGTTHSREYFRTVARLGIQAAEALDHAHQMGIVHRDVKPANLLVDAAGRLWVTDFGLAQIQSDTRLTMTGDLVGTLRYMSPEQALAKRVVVDHRTDIFSLGATLYELLTLEPPFGGADRQELLRQIAFDEPKPPRRINKAIPPELATIVLKALEKNPAERYATAQHLADDLRRHLEDKPIQARGPTPPQRVAKWARRHPTMVWAAVIVLVVTVPVLAASTAWAFYMNAQTATALQLADVRRREADRNAEKAREEGARADGNFQQAIEEMSLLAKAAEDDPTTGKTPQLDDVRNAQATRLLDFFQRLLQQNRTDPVGRLQAGLIYTALIDTYSSRGESAKAIAAYRQGVAVFKQLAADFPTEKCYPEELARIQIEMRSWISAYSANFPMRERQAGRHQQAMTYNRQAVAMADALTTEQPDDRDNWFIKAHALYNLSDQLRAAGQLKEAQECESEAQRSSWKAAGMGEK